MPWSAAFEHPIILPDGRQLLTLRDAADYIAALPDEISGLAQWRVAIEALMLCSRKGPRMLARIAVMQALNRNVAIPFNREAKKLHRGKRKLKRDQRVHPSKRCLNLSFIRRTHTSKEMNATLRAPTARQIEIFRLRCQGLSYSEIACRLGIRRNTADDAARTAATRLIRAQPTLESAADRALALEHFPEIAERFLPTE